MTKKHAKAVTLCGIVAGLILTASVVGSQRNGALLGSVVGMIPVGSTVPTLSQGEVLRRAANTSQTSSLVPAITGDCALAVEISTAFVSAIHTNFPQSAGATNVVDVGTQFLNKYCPDGFVIDATVSSASSSPTVDNHCKRFKPSSARYTSCMGAQESGVVYEQGK